jgi:hypothetical protein
MHELTKQDKHYNHIIYNPEMMATDLKKKATVSQSPAWGGQNTKKKHCKNFFKLSV